MYDLKKIQEKELDILKAVHCACEELNIEYVIMFGTLLGAVRHKGFIPWDDDIDICMTRENYDRFIREGQSHLPNNLRIQHYSTEEECPNIFAKVRDNTTTFLHHEHKDLDINQGVFIDVFPFERIKAGKMNIRLERDRRILFSYIRECYDLSYIRGIHRHSSRFFAWLIHILIVRGILRWTPRRKFIEWEDLRRARLDKKGNDCVFYDIASGKTGRISLIFDRVKLPFETEEFWAPSAYHEVLSINYGNYMKLPPPEKRVTHKPLMVNLEHGYKLGDPIVPENDNLISYK